MTEGFNQKGLTAKSGEVKPTIKFIPFDMAWAACNNPGKKRAQVDRSSIRVGRSKK